MTIQKGRFVTFVSKSELYEACGGQSLTEGKAYKVIAGEGDLDQACGGLVDAGGLNILDDNGKARYILDPTESGYTGDYFGTFELVL